MEINTANLFMISGKEIQPTEMQVAGKDRQTGAEAKGVDRVELSGRVKDIARMDDLIQSVSDVRDSVVEAVRRSIENGTYDVKAEHIAEKMIRGNPLDELL